MSATATLLDARLLAATHALALEARRLVAGALPGAHRSRQPGLAREFSQYRPYQPGDEPRHIDWKLYARSDRYFLRESEIDTRLTVSLVVDATGSMAHRGAVAEGPTKWTLAQRLAAALARLAERQGDALSLHVVTGGQVWTTLTDGRYQPFERLLRGLVAAEPAGRWPTDPAVLVRALAKGQGVSVGGPETTHRLTIVIGDGHEHGDEMRATLGPLRAQRHELVFLQLLCRDEIDFPYRGPVRFEEWETGRVVEADASAVRSDYIDMARREVAAWHRAWAGHRFAHVMVPTDRPPEVALRQVLRARHGR